jgi:superfamily II DNA or RNA helicase
MKSHLGNKGYTIYKNSISSEKLEQIKKDLTVVPFVPGGYGAPSGTDGDTEKYTVFLESNQKIYVPYYYGLRHFGQPTDPSRLYEGDPIDVHFTSQLRENQIPVVQTYLNAVAPGLHDDKAEKSGGLLELYTAFGKTALALYIVSQLKKKTIVIVHKEFLLNQWVERIQQFLPDAKIGRIQGDIMDVEGKDIVLGMLQSISMKTYPESLFRSFGFLIIDETHHISSKVFSQALFKIVTKYTLGLSATMNRKDNTTWVFKDFLGEILYKSAKRELDQQVIVRAIDFYLNDDEFNETKLNYRGDPQYSTMISRLCDSNHRTRFIFQVLTDMVEENTNQQIMILAHNRSLLEELYTMIQHNHLTSCGYYLGGMKPLALKETETKKIVLATYAMAAEALDIKTLSTLIMATPKTDITQSVGRILRDKNRSAPLIVDFIDYHQIFKNQWEKRKSFYRKEGYKIIRTSNDVYHKNVNLSSFWKIIFDPSLSCKNGEKHGAEKPGKNKEEYNFYDVCMIKKTI